MRQASQVVLAFLLLFLDSCFSPEAVRNKTRQQLATFILEFNSSDTNSDESLSDLSEASFAFELRKTKDQLTKLRNIDHTRLSGDDMIDWKFVQSILAGRELAQENLQPWKKNPRLYMTFTQISNIISRPGEVDEKIKDIQKKLLVVPAQLENGIRQLDVYVPRFQELSLFMAENGSVLFDKELPDFIEKAGGSATQLRKPTQDAKAALQKYIRFLVDELPRKQKGAFAIGKEAYNKMLKDQILLSYDADSLWNFGWERFNVTVKELEDLAKEIDPGKTWQQLALEIKNEHPEHDEMIEAHQLWVDKAAAHIKSLDLIPVPWKESVRVVPRAEYLRKTSYYGNFSSAKGPDQDSLYTSEWMINPFEEQWDRNRKQEYLVEHDWGVIIVTAPHETYGGHHVQGLYQLHNPRVLRRNNGISIFSEGWGLYNEQLMEETGFFPTERIHLRQLQLRLWRNARVIYDVGMHTGKLSYEEAIALMTDKVGFLPWAAQLEVDSSTASPGYFIGYFMGMSEILAMREEYKKKMGSTFSLRDFHERLLKIGNMPPALMRESLMM